MTLFYVYKVACDVEMSGEEKESEEEKKIMELLEGNIRLHKMLFRAYMDTNQAEYEEYDQDRYNAFLGVETNEGDFTKWNRPSPNTLTALIEYYLDPDEYHNITFTVENRTKLERWRREINSRFSTAEKERERRVKANGDWGKLRL